MTCPFLYEVMQVLVSEVLAETSVTNQAPKSVEILFGHKVPKSWGEGG